MKTRTKPSLEAPDTAPAAVSAAVAREYPEEGNNAQENGISAGALAALPMIGFAALTAGGYGAMESMGLLVVTGIGFCLLANLLVLPALLVVLGRAD